MGKCFFALERVLDGDEGVSTFSARLQDVQPHVAENSHESGRIAVLNATKTWKEALDDYAEYQNRIEQTTALAINTKADEDASDDLSFESSWSAPLVKTRSNKWTEISYENKEKEPEEATASRGKGKEKSKNKGKKAKKDKEKKDKEKGKNKSRGKEKGAKEKKEKKPKKRENDSGRSEPGKERNPTGEALAKKKKALGGAQRKLSIGMERRGGRGGGI